jgi:hypothetical protein
MPARTTRQAARERLLKMAQAAVDRLVPEDETQPLRGQVFADFENQTYAAGNDLLAAMMEERAKLDQRACAEHAGCCPLCGSNRTYLENESTRKERYSPSGPVIVEEQHARCRACNGSFSPTGEGLGVAVRSRAHAQGRAACGARSNIAKLRPGRGRIE